MSVNPFAGFNPRPSPWGYNWAAEQTAAPQPPQKTKPPPKQTMTEVQLSHLPTALLGSLKRDKKPFTYTPGGVDLSQVLNARLQKRMERKQKYTEEKSRQVVVGPTYNSPLDMYSVHNALEALEVQAGLITADPSLSSRSTTLPRNHTFRFDDPDQGRGVAQSKAFRVLQIITDTEEDVAEKPRPQHRDEMRFTGLRESGAIPSRFFHTLQKITGTEQEDEEDIAQPERPRSVPAQRPISNPVQTFVPNPVPVLQNRTDVSTPCGSTLKRPAAFLKTTAPVGFRRVGNPNAGTDF